LTPRLSFASLPANSLAEGNMNTPNIAAVKFAAQEDIRDRIARGEPIGGEVLPYGPYRIEIRGTSPDKLQARIMYKDRAPYFFNIAPEYEVPMQQPGPDDLLDWVDGLDVLAATEVLFWLANNRPAVLREARRQFLALKHKAPVNPALDRALQAAEKVLHPSEPEEEFDDDFQPGDSE
jgi:hypothetical protein